MTAYDDVPERLLTCLHESNNSGLALRSYCAGFELQQWRCDAFADHAMEWIADYALIEDDLKVNHTNMYVRLKQAAARVYTSEKYQSRGELGEIILHAICRDFFKTIPLAPRVFYLTASNDVVKSFDMAHVKYTKKNELELWLGEAKLYKNPTEAIASAIESVQTHIDAGFLKNQKLLIGPQVSKHIPRYDEIRSLLSDKTSLDKLFSSAVFPICIACDSKAVAEHATHTQAYIEKLTKEINALQKKLANSDLPAKIRMVLIYVPLKSKAAFSTAFDKKLKSFSV